MYSLCIYCTSVRLTVCDCSSLDLSKHCLGHYGCCSVCYVASQMLLRDLFFPMHLSTHFVSSKLAMFGKHHICLAYVEGRVVTFVFIFHCTVFDEVHSWLSGSTLPFSFYFAIDDNFGNWIHVIKIYLILLCIAMRDRAAATVARAAPPPAHSKTRLTGYSVRF